MEKRLFIAIEIKAGKNLKEMIQVLKQELVDDNINWTQLKNIHITLSFIGEVDCQLIPQITESVKLAINSFRSFKININGLGVFGKPKPKILWVGISNTKILKVLSEKINSHLKNISIDLKVQEFKPHITIGRIKEIQNIEIIDNLLSEYESDIFQTVDVSEISLFESKLNPTGPLYTEIEKFKLG